jgi:DNA recombination-dependent growth factor C
MSTKALRNKYGIAIATKIEELQEGELSEVFFHDNQLQIIHLKKIGLMYTQQQDYLPATVITETLMKQRQEEIRSKYLDQLAHKYNTRIRYDLLKLIRAQKH